MDEEAALDQEAPRPRPPPLQQAAHPRAHILNHRALLDRVQKKDERKKRIRRNRILARVRVRVLLHRVLALVEEEIVVAIRRRIRRIGRIKSRIKKSI